MEPTAQMVAAAVRDWFLESAARNYAAHEFDTSPDIASVAIWLHRDGSFEVSTTDRDGLVRGVLA